MALPLIFYWSAPFNVPMGGEHAGADPLRQEVVPPGRGLIRRVSLMRYPGGSSGQARSAGRRSRMAFVSRWASMPNTPYSRPMPDCLKPPNGRLWLMKQAVHQDTAGIDLLRHRLSPRRIG